MHRHHVRVRLELCEGKVEEVTYFALGVRPHEIHGHVVGRPERRREVEGFVRCKAGNFVDRYERTPEGHCVADVVDASPSRSPCQLGEIRRFQGHVALARVAGQLVNDDRSSGHVDADGESLGGEHHFQQSIGEGFFDHLFEGRHETRVVRCDSCGHQIDKSVKIESNAFFLRESLRVPIGECPNPTNLAGIHERESIASTGFRSFVALIAAEDEKDRRQHVAALQFFDYLGSRWWSDASALARFGTTMTWPA